MKDVSLMIYEKLSNDEKDRYLKEKIRNFFTITHITVHKKLSQYVEVINKDVLSVKRGSREPRVFDDTMSYPAIISAFYNGNDIKKLDMLRRLQNQVCRYQILFKGVLFNELCSLYNVFTEADIITDNDNFVNFTMCFIGVNYLMDDLLSICDNSLKEDFIKMISDVNGGERSFFSVERPYTYAADKMFNSLIDLICSNDILQSTLTIEDSNFPVRNYIKELKYKFRKKKRIYEKTGIGFLIGRLFDVMMEEHVILFNNVVLDEMINIATVLKIRSDNDVFTDEYSKTNPINNFMKWMDDMYDIPIRAQTVLLNHEKFDMHVNIYNKIPIPYQAAIVFLKLHFNLKSRIIWKFASEEPVSRFFEARDGEYAIPYLGSYYIMKEYNDGRVCIYDNIHHALFDTYIVSEDFAGKVEFLKSSNSHYASILWTQITSVESLKKTTAELLGV